MENRSKPDSQGKKTLKTGSGMRTHACFVCNAACETGPASFLALKIGSPGLVPPSCEEVEQTVRYCVSFIECVCLHMHARFFKITR